MQKIKIFVKEHKVPVAITLLVIVVAIIIAIFMLAAPKDEIPTSGNDTTVDTPTDNNSSSGDTNNIEPSTSNTEVDNSDSTTAEPSEEDTMSDTLEDSTISNDSNSETEETTTPNESNSETEETTTPNNSNSEKEDSDKKEEGNKETEHSCKFSLIKYDSNNHWQVCSCGVIVNISAHNYSNDSDTTCDTCGYTRDISSVEPTPSVIPSVSWTGTPITLQSLGLSIVTLKDFNDEALTDNTNNTGWAGAVSTDAEQTLANTLNSVRDTMINQGIIGPQSQGFAVEHYQISWSYTSYSSSNDLMLYRNPLDKTYTLTINTPLDSDVFGAHDVAPYSRDVLLTMLSTISSNPSTVFSTLYEDLYGTECISMSSYTSVGDCKIKYDNSQSYNGHYVYLIKAK